NPELPGDLRDLVLHLTFTHVYSDDRIFYTNGPAWTLACEMHYFVLLALLGTLAQRYVPRIRSTGGRYAVLVAGVVALMLLSVGYRAWAVHVQQIPYDSWSAWFNPLAKLDVFALGLLLAIVAASGFKIRARLGRIALLAVAGGLVYLSVLVHADGDQVSVTQHTFAG